ncbi:MAG: ABC transporter ATP-binding protein [Formosimonas sp.]
MSYLVLNQVTKSYNATSTALKGVSFEVKQGEFVSFLGASGCGKTTTLRIIAGFEQEDSGTVTLGGASLSGVSPEKRNLGFVFQQYALFPNMTVRRNIEFGLKNIGLSTAQIKERADEYMDLVRLHEFANRYPHELSGGQQQRVALARALARQPKVLLLDEPLSALDAKIRVHLRSEIKAIQRKLGITTLYVTHDQEEALSMSDRIILMHQGVIEQMGTPAQLYNTPANEYVASFIGTINSLPATLLDASSGTIQLGERVFQLPPAIVHNASRELQLHLRPEKIKLGDADSAQQIVATGKVQERSFLGSVVRFMVVPAGMSDENTIQIDVFNSGGESAMPAVGEQVTFQFSADDCVVY